MVEPNKKCIAFSKGLLIFFMTTTNPCHYILSLPIEYID